MVLVPSHRSYLDFLLVSYVCFATDNPLPVIAAGADFLNMRVVGALFRNSGAIFMRRSFMSDPLYWVVFTEYIQTQLQYGDKTLEFFLEGTRSRTGKFLQPKLGKCLCYFPRAHATMITVIKSTAKRQVCRSLWIQTKCKPRPDLLTQCNIFSIKHFDIIDYCK